MLPIKCRVDQLELNHVFRIKSGLAPVCLAENCVLNTSSQFTRYSECAFAIPRVQGFGKLSFLYTASILWNNLPMSIKNIESKDSFKKAVEQKNFSQILKSLHLWSFQCSVILIPVYIVCTPLVSLSVTILVFIFVLSVHICGCFIFLYLFYLCIIL